MEEKTLKEATVVFPVTEDKIYLALKKRKIGEGCLNGYGGGMEPEDKDPEDCALRELRDESGLIGKKEDLEKAAVLYFKNQKTDGSVFECKVHIYFLHAWTGNAVETDEMGLPAPYDRNDLPFDRMMPADKIWVPLIVKGKKIIAHAAYGPFQKELLDMVVCREVLPEELV